MAGMITVDILEDRLSVRAAYTARSLMQEIPGKRWDAKEGVWTLPQSFASVLAIGWLAKKLRQDIAPGSQEAVDWVAQEQAEWEMLFNGSQTLFADEPVPDWFGHQVQAGHWLAADTRYRGRLDTGETGSGKTASSLRGMWENWNAGATGPALVSTLVSVKSGWASEVERVKGSLPLPGDAEWRVVMLSGTAVRRRKLLTAVREEVDNGNGVGLVVISNHEQLRMHSRMSGYGDIALTRCPKHGGPRDGAVVKEERCEAHPKEFNGIPWSVVVFDEAHRLHNPKAKMSRSAWVVGGEANRAWGLTGTPGSRSVMENTWGLLRLVSGEDFPSKSSWTGYFAETGYDSEGFWKIGAPKAEHEPEFRKLYGSATRRVLKKQVLDLPPLLRGGTLIRDIDMSKEQATAYAQMRDRLKVMTKEGLLTAQNALVQVGRLTGLASATGEVGKVWVEEIVDKDGFPRTIEHMEMNLIAPSNKVSAVVDMVQNEDVSEGTVFQFTSRKLLYLVRDGLIKAGAHPRDIGVIAGDVSEADRTTAREGFQAGRIPWFLFTTGAGGTGITLTRADTMVAVQRPWSPIQHAQAQDRVHRIGSERHEAVTIIDLVTPGTVEIGQLDRLAENAEALEAVVKDRDKLLELLG